LDCTTSLPPQGAEAKKTAPQKKENRNQQKKVKKKTKTPHKEELGSSHFKKGHTSALGTGKKKWRLERKLKENRKNLGRGSKRKLNKEQQQPEDLVKMSGNDASLSQCIQGGK